MPTSLNPHDEFLLTLMRLRLRLLNEDVADRFSLVAWLPQKATRDNLPEAFSKAGNNKCRDRHVNDILDVLFRHKLDILMTSNMLSTFLG